ncbi:hypothetical protein ACJVC5_01330 [Peredibacter sp. HCB2-198]|uniref:hypothetical protein n=1 Tax=Peredibacter sp. HCB2-198 TaxID=3383025 RepID=UPI0038B617CA
MDKLLEELILKYETELEEGIRYLSEMKKASLNYQTQYSINAIWKMILNDLKQISEKDKHDHKKRQ